MRKAIATMIVIAFIAPNLWAAHFTPRLALDDNLYGGMSSLYGRIYWGAPAGPGTYGTGFAGFWRAWGDEFMHSFGGFTPVPSPTPIQVDHSPGGNGSAGIRPSPYK